ncbi:MAG: DegT/DnrJ/EryC1/StrS family aminotransferase, partial [Verrucomicrobiota bacterium]
GVGTQVHYIPVSEQPYYFETGGDCPRAREFYETAISLPLFPSMTEEMVSKVIEVVTEVCS